MLEAREYVGVGALKAPSRSRYSSRYVKARWFPSHSKLVSVLRKLRLWMKKKKVKKNKKKKKKKNNNNNNKKNKTKKKQHNNKKSKKEEDTNKNK